MMTFHQDKTTATGTLALKGELSARAAAEIHVRLATALSNGNRHIVVDLHQVTEADINLFQILCAANRFAFEQGKTFALVGPVPNPLGSLIKMAGLDVSGGCAQCKTACLWARD